MQEFEWKVKKALDEFYGVPPTSSTSGMGSGLGASKAKPIFRKVYIQYKTR